MGSPDSRYISNQDYGRRLYVDNKSYSEQMGVGSRKAAMLQNDALYKQSEFKKPYKEDDYEEMEYLTDAYPGFPWDYDFDTPFVPGENPFGEGGYNPWHVRFLCFSSPCYGWDSFNCEPISCNWPITGYEVLSAPAGCEYKLEAARICGKCPDGETFQILFNVKMTAKFKHNGATVTVQGRYYGMSMSHCFECDDSDLSWDDVNSAENMGQSASAGVFILDGTTKGGSYTWSVSGDGFSFATAITKEPTNTLLTSESACGLATITVTGCAGAQVTGYVRCTAGEWVEASNCYSAVGGCVEECESCEEIVDGQKRAVTYYHITCTEGCDLCEEGVSCPAVEGCSHDSSVCGHPLGDNVYEHQRVIIYNWDCTP